MATNTEDSQKQLQAFQSFLADFESRKARSNKSPAKTNQEPGLVHEERHGDAETEQAVDIPSELLVTELTVEEREADGCEPAVGHQFDTAEASSQPPPLPAEDPYELSTDLPASDAQTTKPASGTANTNAAEGQEPISASGDTYGTSSGYQRTKSQAENQAASLPLSPQQSTAGYGGSSCYRQDRTHNTLMPASSPEYRYSPSPSKGRYVSPAKPESSLAVERLLQDVTDLRARLTASEQEKTALIKRLAQAECKLEEVDELENRLKSAQKNLEAARRNNGRDNNLFDILSQETKARTKAEEALELQRREHSGALKALRKTNEELERKLCETEDALKVSNTHNAQLSTKVTALTQEMHELKRRSVMLEKDYNDARNELETVTYEHDVQLGGIHDQHAKSLTDIESRVQEMKANEDVLLKQLSELITIQEGLLDDNASLEARLKEVKIEKKRSDKANTATVARLQRELETAYNDMEVVSGKCERVVGDMSTKLAEAENETSRYKTRCEELRREVDRLLESEKRSFSSRARIDELNAELTKQKELVSLLYKSAKAQQKRPTLVLSEEVEDQDE